MNQRSTPSVFSELVKACEEVDKEYERFTGIAVTHSHFGSKAISVQDARKAVRRSCRQASVLMSVVLCLPRSQWLRVFSICVGWGVNVLLRRTCHVSVEQDCNVAVAQHREVFVQAKAKVTAMREKIVINGRFVPIAKRRKTKRYRKSFSSSTRRQRMNNMSSASCRHLATRKPQRCLLSLEWHETLPERIDMWETNQTLEAKTQAGRQSSRAVPGTPDREQTQWRRFNWMWTEYERNEVRQQKKALQTDIDNIKRAFLALCEVQTE